ncbi:fasciclin domain-containing protein [Arsenicibacter rosenii]|uniref:FAS1 domain-containing protein n=1 Tax=Arsenicibacter rosenii TaxID=1750698 RepID=A0A1S2VQY1_9BACT|nr:fasciclin domain-containing protein [Arsenicibacter rosenii]OIN60198.1 hypothetical protein BLX24_05020 [Arsenicibacter rosenii]
MRIARNPFVKALAVGVLVSGILFGCKKDGETGGGGTAQPKTAADVVKEDANYSIFQAALTRANLTDALKATNLTVFLPNNAAFQASGFADAAAISALPVATAESIVNYHVLNGKVAVADIPGGTNVSVQTKGGQSAYITKTTSGTVATVSINGAKVVTPDVQSANGILHVIDRVLVPPTTTMLDAAKADPANFSLVVAAINRASTVNPTLTLLLSSSTSAPVTVFLPDNAAMTAAGLTAAAINSLSPTALSALMSYHTTNSLLFSSQLAAGQLLMFSGGKVTVTASATGTATLKGTKNTTAVNIKRANWLTTNGIIHVIDQVLQQ